MHTPSTRALSALAYERGEDYDPGQPPAPDLLGDLELAGQAHPIVDEAGPADRRRRRDRERRRALAAIPEWFSADDLIAAPWETAHRELI
ncbi:MAG TPA: hypothetical protein VKB80_26740 [Kofleriaceae bacterium]|nr:hypothetical protein [Kofleriaceae bacterium]